MATHALKSKKRVKSSKHWQNSTNEVRMTIDCNADLSVSFCLVANNEMPISSLATIQNGTARRSSSDKPAGSRRRLSRHSKMDSLAVKVESQNIRKIVEDDHETTAATSTDATDNKDESPKHEDEMITDAADCSIM